MSFQERLALLQQTMGALNPHYRETIQQTFNESGMQGADWFLCYLAYGIEPAPLTVTIMQQLTPYANAETQATRLEQTAEKGFLQSVAGGFGLTPAGRQGVESFFQNAGQAIAPLKALPENKTMRLADLLGRIVAATNSANPPAQKLAFTISRRTDPGPDVSPTRKIDQFLTDLQPYRDDAHIAAWQETGVDGRTWEAFSYLWQNGPATVATVADALTNRNFTEADYQDSVAQLVERGWVLAQADSYQLTDTGRELREQIEAKTDALYFSGWSALSEDESDELDTLLAEFRDQLRNLTAAKATEAFKESQAHNGAIANALFKLTRAAMEPCFAELDLSARGLAYMLVQAGQYAPEPISTAGIRRRLPYSSPQNWQRLLAQLAEKGLLTGNDDDGYLLTENGSTALAKMIAAFNEQLATIEVEADLERLATLLGRVVGACRNAPQPPGTYAISHTNNLPSTEEGPVLAKIDHYLDALNAFRDDAHLAAFAPHEISGHGWELFTMLWNKQVAGVSEMVEKMAFRGHSEATYQLALDDLVLRGWVAVADDVTTVTEAGKAIRESAELLTDHYYFLPWSILSEAQSAEYVELLASVAGQLTVLAEAEAVPA